VLTQDQTQTTYTVGEDGQVRAWKSEASTGESMDVDEETDAKKDKKERREKRKEKKEKKHKKRYEPY
jgi:hypothetical protein